MPIDPRIPLLVNAPQIDSPMQMASNLQSIRAAREHSQELQRQRMEDEQIRSIFQQSQGDMDGALSRIRQVNPLKAAAIEDTWTKSRKASAELQKLELERTGKLQELLSQELGNVTDQTSWDHYRAYATAVRHSANLPPPALDETYSPEKVEHYKLNGMALKDQVAQKHQALVDAANAAREERMAADQRADNERQAAAAEQSKRQFETTEARQNREFAVTSGLARQSEARQAKAALNPQARPLTQTAESNIISKLSNQWTAATKSTRELDRAVGLMDTGLAAARRGDLAQGAQTILVTFQKLLDPTSVVRESEFDRSAAGQSLITRAQGAVERLASGGAGVPLSELEKFAALGREMAAAQKSTLGPTRARIKKTADRYNIPEDLVLEGDSGTGAAPGAAPGKPRFEIVSVK